MFNTMINGEGSFAEKKDRKVSVPFSRKAVEMMVKGTGNNSAGGPNFGICQS